METKELTSDQVASLKAPLPPESIKPHPTKPFLSSIKVIYIVERMNEVFGLGRWRADNRVVEKVGKMVVVETTFTAPEYGIVVTAFGGNDNDDLGDAYKGACTDALSKIGSYLYIGMDVYKGLSGKGADKKATPADKKPVEVKTEKVTGFVVNGRSTDVGTWVELKNGENKIAVFSPAEINLNGMRKGMEVELECVPKKNKKQEPYFLLNKIVSMVEDEHEITDADRRTA